VQVPEFCRVLLDELHRPIDSRIATNVQVPFTGAGKKPGDIDLLIAHPARPHEAIAIECKRVKITVESAGNDHLNKIEEVVTGVKQANALREFGFYQTYLCVIAVVDAAAQQHWNVLNRGIDANATYNYSEQKTFSRFISFPGREDLNKEVGIAFLEVVQPTNRPMLELMSFGISVQQAAKNDQRSELTNRVSRFFRQD
jgi:hypothetical protein